MFPNLWTSLLKGLITLIKILIIIPLFGGPENYHQAMGLAAIIGNGALAVIEVSMVALSTFNLGFPIAALLINFMLFIINLAIRGWLLLKSIIKIW